MTQTADAAERKRALDPEKSFIVQAPAGSGKTGLLIQRYLALLAGVKSPEEIVAITFTRKAAAEMRNRVLEALAGAEDDHPPEKDHERLTWQLARRARERNESESWRMEKYPSRMRIMTIDSLCAGLTRQMPVLSGFGAPAGIAEDPEALYARAARNTVAELESGKGRSDAVENLVIHMDNRLADLERLIAGMLPKRDQWLRHVAGPAGDEGIRRGLESAMQAVITRRLSYLRSLFPEPLAAEAADLCRFAAQNLDASSAQACALHEAGRAGLSGFLPRDLEAWKAAADLFLTKDGGWRKNVNRAQGFPPPGSAKNDPGTKQLLEKNKKRFKKLTADLSEIPELCEVLDSVRGLPAPEYSGAQWSVLACLLEILKLAAAHLQTVFGQTKTVDFTETAIRARTALGGPDSPTDLALCLDYRISHILMDEFQDTSISQFELMRGLTAGWTPGDGRSFFAVGDPMQSIYGFREAEVGLFLRAWHQGLDENLPLEPLALKSNFRSDRGIVEWVNRVFSQVLPEKGDPDTGAVPYMPAEPAAGGLAGQAARIWPLIGADEQREAELVVEAARQSLDESPEGTVAVLVRSRPHLKAVVPEFRRAGLSFSAVETESLARRPVVRDLLSLTRAVCHPADRAAWLAVLRAPWCGLCLKDLYALAGTDHRASVYTLIHQDPGTGDLSPEGKKRLSRVSQVMDRAIRRQGRDSLRNIVEGAWLALGGPAAACGDSDLADASVYLDYLESYAGCMPVSDLEAFERGVFSLFAAPDPSAGGRLQIMTIHRAKGLEFDTVIIPGLEKTPAGDEPELLVWQELTGLPENESLLMAPIPESGADRDPTYGYIRRLRQVRARNETGRLLYVAATRARKSLHLFGSARLDTAGRVCRPDSRSLLAVLWPVAAEQFEKEAQKNAQGRPAEKEAQSTRQQPPGIRRFPSQWQPPEPRKDLCPPSGEAGRIDSLEQEKLLPVFDWAGLGLRRVGVVVHRWLRVICEQGLENWGRERIRNSAALLRRDLLRTGMGDSDVESLFYKAEGALINAVSDDTGRWILSLRENGACEYAVSGLLDGKVVNAVIDRTFEDENGTRWVIDYKTGTHSGGGLSDFLDREQHRYSLQMERYGLLMKNFSGAAVRLGLYFPMIPAWRQWGLSEE